MFINIILLDLNSLNFNQATW